MADAKVLYKRLGPVLFARARRIMKDDSAAEKVTMSIVEELARLEGLSDNELLKRARARLQVLLDVQGSGGAVDSLLPGDGKP